MACQKVCKQGRDDNIIVKVNLQSLIEIVCWQKAATVSMIPSYATEIAVGECISDSRVDTDRSNCFVENLLKLEGGRMWLSICYG